MHIYLDVETIPSQRADVRARLADAQPTPPSNYKDPKKIAAYLAEHADDWREEWHRTALEGGYGELCVISWAIDDGPTNAVARPTVEDDEAVILGDWFTNIAHELCGQMPTWVGHNIGFDLRFLHHRSVVLGVKPSVHLPYNAPAWRNAYIDTMYEWVGAKGGVKLTTLCDMLGITVNDDIDGSQVWDRYQAGDIDAIVKHCRADVERVRQIAKRLRYE